MQVNLSFEFGENRYNSKTGLIDKVHSVKFLKSQYKSRQFFVKIEAKMNASFVNFSKIQGHLQAIMKLLKTKRRVPRWSL
ncbi:MAG: hypothetical protein A2277_18385 [Desulfobacterales bacterium RIFOXYA12_FULL_46_15]|nr:MAG: hypothetical protein A2097_11810 [Desulfobacula sp. GWF2_41_7]OGR22043.1 MAG: hypothetical protein A2277_18385 [Desulfobacterales bacterium RIFOXYA12_FULL_46_15]